MRRMARVAAMLLCTTSLAACGRGEEPTELAGNEASALEAGGEAQNDVSAAEAPGFGEDFNMASNDAYDMAPAATGPPPKMSGPPADPFVTGTPPPPPPPR